MYNLTTEEVLKEVKSFRKGLTSKEAKNRLLENGKNELKLTKKRSLISKIVSQFNNVICWVLFVALLTNIIAMAISKETYQVVNVLLILAVIVLNVVLGIKRTNEMEDNINKINMAIPAMVKVQRSGKIMKVDSSELVVGDVVYLSAGDIVPTDLRIIDSNSLFISDTAITGQTMAVEKFSNVIDGKYLPLGERNNMTYYGSSVASGSGVGIVVATGKNTELGKTANLLTDDINIDTPIIRKLKHIINILAYVVLGISVLFFIVNFIGHRPVETSFMLTCALSVCIIPESLLLSILSTYSKSIKNMANHHMVVKDLASVENLGRVDVLCIDKTKVLTIDYKSVRDVWVNNTDDYELENNPNFVSLINCMLLCNNAISEINPDNRMYVTGESSEKALVSYGYEFGFSKPNLEGIFPRVNILPYDRYRKMMTTLNSVGDETHAFTRGDFERVLNKCTKILEDGKPISLTDAHKRQLFAYADKYVKEGCSIMGFATKVVTGNVYEVKESDVEFDMTFVGICAISNPAKNDIESTIKICKNAGVKVCMLTSDEKENAYNVAKTLGIASSIKNVVTGEELDMMTDIELYDRVSDFTVFSKLLNGQKLRIVKALQQENIVAVTGDNVEDLAVIKRADVGIGLGNSGCEIVKQASSIVTADDSLTSIIKGVEESRKVNSNVKKMASYMLSTAFAQILLVSVIVVALGMSFFSPSLILWINMINGLLPCLALGSEPIHKNVMKKPMNKSNRLFVGSAGANIIVYAIIQYVIIALLYVAGTSVYMLPTNKVVTMCFVAFAVMQIFHAYNMKNTRKSLFSFNLFNNTLLNLGFAVSLLLTMLFVALPIDWLHLATGTTILTSTEWLICIGVGALIIPIVEGVKIIERMVHEHKVNNNL